MSQKREEILCHYTWVSICLGQLYTNPEQLLSTDTPFNTLYHRNTERLVFEGTSGGHIVQPPGKAGSPRANRTWLSQVGFEYLWRRTLHHLSGGLVQCTVTFKGNKLFRMNFLCFSLYQMPISGSTLLTPTLKIFLWYGKSSSQPPLLQAEQAHLPQPFLSKQMFLFLNHPLSASPGPPQ